MKIRKKILLVIVEKTFHFKKGIDVYFNFGVGFWYNKPNKEYNIKSDGGLTLSLGIIQIDFLLEDYDSYKKWGEK